MYPITITQDLLENIQEYETDLIPRQCGLRHDGAAYAVGAPFKDLETMYEFFVRDGNPFPTEHLNLSKQGMNPIMRPGTEDDPIYDFYDVIGGDYEVWDWINETRVLGWSRKFPKDLLGLVDPDGRSMHIMVHDHAITNIGSTLEELPLYQQPTNDDRVNLNTNEFTRRLQCGVEYTAGQLRDIPVQYKQGAFFMAPITRFEVIKSEDNSHFDALSKLNDLGFDLNLVDN